MMSRAASRYFPSTLAIQRTLTFPASTLQTRHQTSKAFNAEPCEPAPSDPSPSQTNAIDSPQPPPPSFYSLLRNSNFVKLGNLRRSPKPVVGEITHVVDDDLYIDFGGKFKTVCSRPRNRGHLYKKGRKVVIALHDLEMTSRFLGAYRDTTLLEADATLLGLAPRLDAEADALPKGEEVEEEEETVSNLSDTLTYDLDTLFLDPKRMEGALFEIVAPADDDDVNVVSESNSVRDDSDEGDVEK